MKYLKNTPEFIFENLRIDESLFYMSPKMREFLNKLSNNNQIASELVDVEATDVKPDMTFIDLTDKEGFISFTQIKKAKKLYDEQYGDEEESPLWSDPSKMRNGGKSLISHLYNADMDNLGTSTGIFKKGRNQIKIGKLVNKVFPGKFQDKEVEEFVNLFKSGSVETDTEVFELVSGDEIAYWYDCDQYYDYKGTLGSSCMRNMDEDVFEIYTDNPEVKMLILKDVKSNKILGRAIIWMPTFEKYYGDNHDRGLDDVDYFMDRVYTIKDSDVNKFHEYANKKGWAHKTQNNYSSHSQVTYKGNNYNVEMEVSTTDNDYSKFPYMDTFAEFLDGTLYNNCDSDNGGYTLTDTNGGYDDPSMVYSEYHDARIPDEEAVYSEAVDSYIRYDDSVRIDDGSHEGWYPTDHEDIVYDDHRSEYVHREDCVYSEWNDEYIYYEDYINAITDLSFQRDKGQGEGSVYSESYFRDDDEDVIRCYTFDQQGLEWYKVLSKKYKYEDYDGIHTDLLSKDEDGNWILDGYMIDTYGNEDEDIEFLSINDHKLLNSDLTDEYIKDNYHNIVEDEFTYMKRVWIDSGRKLKDLKWSNELRSHAGEIEDFLNYWYGIEKLDETVLNFKSFSKFNDSI